MLRPSAAMNVFLLGLGSEFWAPTAEIQAGASVGFNKQDVNLVQLDFKLNYLIYYLNTF